MAAESIKLRHRVNQDQILHRRPNPQPRRRETAEEVEEIEDVEPPASSHKSPHHALDPPILASSGAGGWFKALTRAQSVLLDVVGEMQEGREGVRELQNTDGGNDSCEAGEIGDGGADDEGDGPVDGNDGDPKEFTGFLG